jgi:hypothetical protein
MWYMFLPFPILPLVHHNSVCIFLLLIIYYVLLQLQTTCTSEDNHGANVSHGAIPVNVCLYLIYSLICVCKLFFVIASDVLSLFDRFNVRPVSTFSFALDQKNGLLLTR